MKKFLYLLLICVLCLTGCSDGTSSEDTSSKETPVEEPKSDEYSIGDEIDLGGVKFNVYKINDDSAELYLLAQNDVATTPFSEAKREQKYMHDYEGSLVEGYVNEFVDALEDKGLVIKESGIICKDDLIELGFDVYGLNGTSYKINDTLEFINVDDHFWVGGYSKYDTYAWTCSYGIIENEPCEDEYGVRPIIVIESSETSKELQEIDPNLTIKEIVDSSSAWTSEGGIHNPYDLFYFDCEKMIFTNVFESSEFSQTSEFAMEFIDDYTIQVDGLMRKYEYPAEITIINENKLRIRFVDNEHNDGDYFLNKTNE